MIAADFFNLVAEDSNIKSEATTEWSNFEDYSDDNGTARELDYCLWLSFFLLSLLLPLLLLMLDFGVCGFLTGVGFWDWL